MRLDNVEIRWAKLDPAKPDNGYSGDKPQWRVQMVTRDKAQMEEWKSIGLNPNADEEDGSIIWKVTVRKDAVNSKTGDTNPPVRVFDRDALPFSGDVNAIGNGSIVNIRLRSFDWKFQGKEGTSFRLDAIQINQLVEYAAGPREDDFTALDVPETSKDDEDLF